MDSSDRNRLSVTLVDVAEGKEAEFVALAGQFGALLVRKEIRDLRDDPRRGAPAAVLLRAPVERCRRGRRVPRRPRGAEPDGQAVSARPHHARRQRRPACRSAAPDARRPADARRSRPPYGLRPPTQRSGSCRRRSPRRSRPAPRSPTPAAPARRDRSGRCRAPRPRTCRRRLLALQSGRRARNRRRPGRDRLQHRERHASG